MKLKLEIKGVKEGQDQALNRLKELEFKKESTLVDIDRDPRVDMSKK